MTERKRMRVNLLKIFQEKFGIKVFAVVTVFLLVISSSFTAFFIYQQSKSLTDTLIRDSKLLTAILAYSVRLGVFSENKDLLRDTVEGIFQQEEVVEVAVFNLEKELVKKQKNTGTKARGKSGKRNKLSQNEIFEKLKQGEPLYFLDGGDTFELWSPVMAGASYATEEYLVLGENPLKGRNRIIGFVGITIDKTGLNTRLNILLLKSILIGIVFLGLGSFLTYIITKRITNPLKRLTEGVDTLRMGGEVKEVPVETEDEIGNLAKAFNIMTESLAKREAEKSQLEEQLRQAQKMEAIGTLAGGVAHDFNNILTAIIGFGSLLQMKMDKSTPSRVHVDQILASAERAASLTQSLLAFSRRQVIIPKPLNLNETIMNIKKLLSRLIREDIEFQLQLTREHLIVMADSGQMDQVLMNLVTNARDAMPDGGVLTIATEVVALPQEFSKTHDTGRPGRYALLSVTDTGVGMDEKTKERIFDPFFTTKEVGRGTGLGLSMIYGIIKQHEGYIDVSSTPDRGTTFRLYLPLIESTLEKEQARTLQLPKGGTETVLIAEDDTIVRMFSKEILEFNGYKVIEAIDGVDAVRKFNKNKQEIQLLLLDVIMPKKNGKEVYNEIVKIRPDIKALFVSGYTSDIIQQKGMFAEGINFIPKPVSAEVLLQKVREVLDGKSPFPS
ncbi:MAG: ATP-binding protein [Pseudomonadota bacterium]